MGFTLTSKSQVTVPKPIRDHLKVAPGDAVQFRIAADGSVHIESVSDPARGHEPSAAALAKYRGLMGSVRTGMSTDEWMNMLRGYDEDAIDPGFGGVAAPR